MPRSKPGASCVPFVLRVVQIGNRRTGEITAKAFDSGGRQLGFAHASWNPEERSLDVYHAFVDEPTCGIGTRLYEAMAAEACARQVNLRSDVNLSNYSKSFWAKQVRKGRAEWDDVTGRYVLNRCALNLEGKKLKPRSRKRR